MRIDLIEIADDLHGIPDSETKISVPCPVHGELNATITLTGSEKLQAVCADGCETKALWAGLVKASPTLARLWVERKSKKEEEQANARASGPAAAESKQPPRPETQTNGHHSTETKAEETAHWKNRLGLLAYELLKADPEYHKANLTVQDIKEPLRREIFASTQSSEFDPRWAVYKPPAWMEEADQWAMIGNACEVGWDLFRQQNRNDLILLNSNGTVPKVVDPEPENPLPTVFVRKKIELLTLDKLRERRQAHVQKWIVDPWLARGELSIWSGKVEHGKTSVLRELVMCALRGDKFLDRPTERCRVFYAMLDADGEDLTYDEFEKMGINEYDTPNIMFMFEPMIANMQNGPEQFFKALWEWRPDLVIIDPVARLKQVADFLDYNNTYMMAMLSQYAKTLDAHFCLPMHIPRGRPAGASAATAAFGSVAWGASANARFVVERKEPSDVHVIRTSKGKSAGFQGLETEHVLEMNQDTHRITLGKPLSFGDRARGFKRSVLDFLRGAPCEEFTGDALAHQLGEMRAVCQAAANMLAEDQQNHDKGREHGNPTGVKRTGKGKRGSPFVYRYESPRDDVSDVDLNTDVSDVKKERF